MEKELIVSIDPDVEKSGVAELNKLTNELRCYTYTFPMLLEYLLQVKDRCEMVIVEAGYLNAPHWHILPMDSKAVCAAKGNAVGRNHETARKIIEMCQHYGIKVHGVKPLKKQWKGNDGKITHDELIRIALAKKVNGFPKRTNQDVRDAILLVLVYS